MHQTVHFQRFIFTFEYEIIKNHGLLRGLEVLFFNLNNVIFNWSKHQ